MRDASVEILTTQISSAIIDRYTKWKNRNNGPSQGFTNSNILPITYILYFYSN